MILFLLFLFPDELAELRAENAKLKRENKELIAKVVDAEKNGFVPDGPGFKSIIGIISELPDDLKPTRELWSDFDFQKVKLELQKHTGSKITAKLPIRDVTVKQNTERLTDPESPEYVITIFAESEPFPYKGKTFWQSFDRGPFSNGYEFKGDDALAKAAIRLRNRKYTIVAGTITKIEITSHATTAEYNAKISLTDRTFDWPDK